MPSSHRKSEAAPICRQCCRQPEQTYEHCEPIGSSSIGADACGHPQSTDGSGLAHETPVGTVPDVMSLGGGLPGHHFCPEVESHGEGTVLWLENPCPSINDEPSELVLHSSAMIRP